MNGLKTSRFLKGILRTAALHGQAGEYPDVDKWPLKPEELLDLLDDADEAERLQKGLEELLAYERSDNAGKWFQAQIHVLLKGTKNE